MSYTDQDVERVAEAIFNETVDYPAWDDLPDTWDSSYGPGKDHYRSIARAAMEAIEREPLEDVLGGDLAVSHVSKDSGYLGWFAKVEDAIGVRYHGHGTTIDEAIRAAVAAATERGK